MTAMAIEAFAPDMDTFRGGRDFAARLGLVPRQFSSGGKERLGRVSKAGQADIRRLLIIGAMACVNWASRKPPLQGGVAGTNAGEEATNVGRDRSGEQDGPENLGHAHEAGRL
jgi:hypothetical protein